MNPDPEVLEFLLGHLDAIRTNDIPAYQASTHTELTMYEWWVTPNRIDGLPFHEFMMSENERRGSAFGFEIVKDDNGESHTRMDLANLHIQRYGDTAIASYTLLMTSGLETGVVVAAHNESRVMVKLDGRWQVVHVHKSPAWSAPYQPKII